MRTRRSLVVVCSFVVVLSVGPPAGASPGDLDPSFSSDGIRYVRGVALDDVVVQPDDRVVVVGHTTGTVRAGVALRFTVDGTLDPSFGGDGRVRLRIASPSEISIQPDGRVVVAGLGIEPGAIAVERLTPQGTRDSSFSGDGMVTARRLDPWTDDLPTVRGMAIDVLGRITVVFGSAEQPDHVDRLISLLVQWEPNGVRRWGFGPDGVAWAKRCDEPGGLAVQADRKLVVTGIGADDAIVGPDADAPCLTRLNTNGTLDGTFGTHGHAILGLGWEIARGVKVSPTDGTISALYYEDRGTVGRVLPTGQLDPTFGTGGVLTGDPDDAVEWWDLDLQGRKVVLAGWSRGLGVARLTASGTPDPTFGSDGIASADAPSARAVDVQGHAIVTVGWTFDGTTPTGGAVVRFVA